ncbi:MAG: hypothetical protein ACR2G2_08180 [Pseudonocardia sp.]
MPRTREQIEQAAREAADYIENLSDDEVEFHPAPDLAALGLALAAVSASEANLAGTVAVARANGRSWSEIGMVLGVSKQAAAKRYPEPVLPR